MEKLVADPAGIILMQAAVRYRLKSYNPGYSAVYTYLINAYDNTVTRFIDVTVKLNSGNYGEWSKVQNDVAPLINPTIPYGTALTDVQTMRIGGNYYSFSRPVVLETGALVKKLYSEISPYKLIFMYGYRDALNAPNQFMFCFMPDQLQIDGEDLQFLAMAGSSNWEYPIRVKRNSDGYVYWWSAYDYGGNTTFYVTKIVGVK